MEIISKIKQIMPLMCILLTETLAGAQNYYVESEIYYNMDTANCIPEARDFFAEWDVLDSLPVLDNKNIYNVYKATLLVPILKINDSCILKMVEEGLEKSLADGAILFPDTSGYFVCVIFEPDTQDLQYRIMIDPTSNYYMYDMLVMPHQCCYCNNMGCFYYGSILCVIQSCCDGENLNGSCFWEKTESCQEIKIYQQELEFATEYYGPVSYYHAQKCK